MSDANQGMLALKTWVREEQKDKLPPGPWQLEPDKAHWIDPATDYDCLIVRNHSGALCGYVGVTEGHLAYERSYDDVGVSVHGGLTFAEKCQESEKGEAWGVCHTPLPGRDPEVWWLGFDCAHYSWDLIPSMIGVENSEDPVLREMWELAQKLSTRGPDPHYWTFTEVVEEVTRLAAQLAAIPIVIDP